jgi:hypothetical protein
MVLVLELKHGKIVSIPFPVKDFAVFRPLKNGWMGRRGEVHPSLHLPLTTSTHEVEGTNNEEL